MNTVLLPAWAATTFWFLRSYKTKKPLYSMLTGVGAAACMLGKYWSVFLLTGLVLAALIDTRRWAYFRSTAPWITAVVGLALLGPHLVWLYQSEFAPLAYATALHAGKSFIIVAQSLNHGFADFGQEASAVIAEDLGTSF